MWCTTERRYLLKNVVFFTVDLALLSLATYYWFYVHHSTRRPVQEVLLFALIMQFIFVVYHIAVEYWIQSK